MAYIIQSTRGAGEEQQKKRQSKKENQKKDQKIKYK